MPLLQLLREVDVVEAEVGRGHQPDDFGAYRRRAPPPRGLGAAAMDQAPQPLTPPPALESLELPHAEMHGASALLVGDLAGQGLFRQILGRIERLAATVWSVR